MRPYEFTPREWWLGDIRCRRYLHRDTDDEYQVVWSARHVDSTNDPDYDDVDFCVPILKALPADQQWQTQDATDIFFETVVAQAIVKAYGGRDPFHPYMFHPYKFARPKKPYVFTAEDAEDWANPPRRCTTSRYPW